MKPISAEKNSSVISLLKEGYPHHEIIAKTVVGIGTVNRINKEVNLEKENNPGGHPPKLSTWDKQSIIYQITSGKLDNAVQATQFINNVISDPVTPQTVRNALKESGLYSATKKKVPMLKKAHHQRHLQFSLYHENWTVEDWKRVLWSDETKINQIGSDGKI